MKRRHLLGGLLFFPFVGQGGFLSAQGAASWVPVIRAHHSDPVVEYRTQFGRYTVVDGLVVFTARIEVDDIEGGRGVALFSLPVPAAVGGHVVGSCVFAGWTGFVAASADGADTCTVSTEAGGLQGISEVRPSSYSYNGVYLAQTNP